MNATLRGIAVNLLFFSTTAFCWINNGAWEALGWAFMFIFIAVGVFEANSLRWLLPKKAWEALKL
ncbi:hypothetical protein GCM10009104_25710 [Marinobacterium maritimum]|uniref:Uncharacterized protein n=1 Tax=Marinobacterium maritimum TaxID=500162 RepID=A0ABN1I8C6_9GAMM